MSARDTDPPASRESGLGARAHVLLAIAISASLLLPTRFVAVALFGLGALWWWRRPLPGSRRLLGGVAGLLAVALLIEMVSGATRRDPERFQRDLGAGYERIWRAIDVAAERTAARLAAAPDGRQELLAAFQVLGDVARTEREADLTLLLLDGEGVAVAWAGKGLLHDLVASDLPERGRTHYASFSAVTLLAVRPLEVGAGEWRIAAGRSLRTDRFPFARLPRGAPRWTVVPPGTELGDGLLRVVLEDSPVLVVEPSGARAESTTAMLTRGWQRLVLSVWGAALLVATWLVGGGGPGGRWWRASGAAGLALLAIAAAAPWWAVLVLVTAGTLLLWSWPRARGAGGRARAWAFGSVAFLAAPALGLAVQALSGPLDLGSVFWSSPADLVCRLAVFALVWGLLSLVAESGAAGRSAGRAVGGLSLALILASAALPDQPLVASILLAISGAAFADWFRGRGAGSRPATMWITGLVAAIVAAAGWEIAYRQATLRNLQEEVLPALAPPSAEELDDLASEIGDFLAASDVQELAPAGAASLERQDLAFEVWHHSPLSRYGGLSALWVTPPDDYTSSFSFGLPVDEAGGVDWPPLGWGFGELPVWRDAVVAGEGDLRLAGEPWARVGYWLALRPGFRLPVDREEDLAAGLLRAGPRGLARAVRGPAGVEYGLWDRSGQPRLSPWKNPPTVPENLLDGGRGRLPTPAGPAHVFSAVGEDGVRILFLPVLSPLFGLERVGTHALTALVILGALALVLRLPALRRVGLETSWHRVWHSYSRRLALVYSTLLLVPLALMNAVVVRLLEERLHSEQEAAGQSALESAQRVLGEYVLALEPGFGIDAALDDELLSWLAGVVHHDVNLYWRSSVYASSKAELFTAGLLPRRIPGEIYSRLTLLGHGISTRTNEAGGAEYLELYAPLVVPGVSFDETRLFLSLPLLAQQEQTAAQIASLRRRASLGAVALVLLIVVLGVRLARRFTAPLTEIVEGTQRIAAGEASLELRPTELELATLVDAIDAMAARIAEGRQRLLREKSVVERMVENITSGVVSLDGQRRVLMANRVAVELIGVEVGEELSAAVARQRRLAPLATFLERVGERGLAQQTVSLEAVDGGEQEWSLVRVPLPGAGEPSALLVLEDVTEVLRSQRLQAWAEMARMIAHEIKNPLTPIRLSAEHMREVYDSDREGFGATFESCTANILRQVGELQQIASEFSTYSRIPRIEPRPGDLTAVVEEIVDGYRTAAPRGIRFEVKLVPEGLQAVFDAKLIGRAIRNLIENALRVSAEGGTIRVTVDKTDGKARIAVADTGPGVGPALLSRIFDPYFSTHDSGTGLGLPIARRIAEEHGGEVTARNRRQGGLEVTIWLPAEEQ